jgi:MFS transporter, DHA2 family, multidrug resistance protein
MSARSTQAGALPLPNPPPLAGEGRVGGAGTSPWLIAILVAVASFMEVLDTTVANVLLQYIAGAMGVSQDEASWVVTTYLVANAVSLTASSFLTQRLGRKTFFVICLGAFTVSSVLCAYAWNLQAMLLFRIVQGLGGGGMVPVAQPILADAFPPEKRGQGFALFGVAVVVAPVVGPTLGGWLADNYSWRWAFLINAPVGLITMGLIALVLREPAAAAAQRRRERQQGDGFDIGGFVLVATFLGALEIMLDRGLEDDWFGSNFIVGVAVVCALAFVLMIPWEISRRNPAVDLRMIATRQFGACFLVMLATGALLFGTTQFLPQLVQQDFAYTATWAGLVLSPGGVVTMLMMFVVGRLSGRVQPRYLIAVGAVLIALSMYVLTNVYGGLDFWFMARSRMLFGVGVSLIFIPIIAASYDGLPPGKTDQASAMLNAARNTGGSIGISLVQNVLWDREQFHQSMLVDQAIPSGVQYQDTLHQMTKYVIAQGRSLVQAHQQAIQWIGQQVQAQASYLGYMDAFWLLTLISLAAVPLALTLSQGQARRRRSHGPVVRTTRW